MIFTNDSRSTFGEWFKRLSLPVSQEAKDNHVVTFVPPIFAVETKPPIVLNCTDQTMQLEQLKNMLGGSTMFKVEDAIYMLAAIFPTKPTESIILPYPSSGSLFESKRSTKSTKKTPTKKKPSKSKTSSKSKQQINVSTNSTAQTLSISYCLFVRVFP
jgi:hypothetical protein